MAEIPEDVMKAAAAATEAMPLRVPTPFEVQEVIAHAEQNIIAFAAREGIRTNGCTITVTHHPCSACARSIIQAGIVCVEIGDGKTSMPPDEFEAAAQMFQEAGIRVVGTQEKHNEIIWIRNNDGSYDSKCYTFKICPSSKYGLWNLYCRGKIVLSTSTFSECRNKASELAGLA